METLLNSGIGILLVFQSWGEWLIAPMKTFSFLGTEDFYILALPIIYWSFDAALGLRIGVIMLLSSGVNTVFKFAFHSPRPYWVNTEVQVYSAESSFGLPSGHAQNAIAIWGMVGTYFKKSWVWAVSIILILGISLSRLYLAVHFPLDTALGLLVGFILLIIVNRAWTPIAEWAKKQNLSKQLSTAFLGSLILLFVGGFVAWMLRDWTLPVAWMQNAARAGGEAPDPLSINSLIASAATLFGLLAGLAWIEKEGGYTASGTSKQRYLRYLVGLVGLAILYIGLKVVFPSGENLVGYIFRYIRYSLVGFWISGAAPFIFLKLNLTETSR